MKILIIGGSGFIGKEIKKNFEELGHEVLTLSRHRGDIVGDLTKGPLSLPVVDVVINLAGENLGQNLIWTKSFREKISNSRILLTRNLVSSLEEQAQHPFPYLISVTGSAIYEKSGFLHDLSLDWEKEALAYKGERAIVRLGVVLGEKSLFNKRLALLSKVPLLFLPFGGKNHIPTIELSELSLLMTQLLIRKESQIVNGITAYKTFKEHISEYGRPIVLSVPSFLIKMVLGVSSEMLLGNLNENDCRVESSSSKSRVS